MAGPHASEEAAAFLGRLDCAPHGLGAASAIEFAQRLIDQAHVDGGPLALFIIGEPLSGKSAFLYNLLRWLLTADASLRVRLMRWGDAMRAQRHLGLLPADRLPGDLSNEEFAGLSAFVGEQVREARATMAGPGLVVAEFPGCTAVNGERGLEGLDRGFSTCRSFVEDRGAHYVALTAEAALRGAFLQTREAAPGAATEARSATPLAANRIREQVTALMIQLQQQERMAVSGVAAGALAAAFDGDPALREQALYESYMPYLLQHEIGVPSERALIARNVLLPPELRGIAEVDAGFVDQFDYIRERYSI